MNTEETRLEDTPIEVVGPPAKFDAEPVRRKSRRWVYILLAVFFGIAGAVGLGVLQIKSYLHNTAIEREANQKRGAEDVSQHRGKKTFDLEASLPETFPVTEDQTAPIQVVATSTPRDTVPSGVITTPAMTGAPVTAAASPTRRSMMLDSEQIADAKSAEDEAIEIAKRLSAVGGPEAGPSAAGLSAGLNAGNTQQRPKTVQAFANKSQGPVTKTPQALATMLGDRDYLLAKSASIPCTLQTQLNSTVAGPVKCVVSQDIFSDNGKVVLIERGSTIDGEYKSTLKPGDARIAIIWSRIKTPNGIVVDVDSPAADSIGTVGVSGDVDNHWMQRIGAAFLLSMIDDVIRLQTAKSGAQAAGANGSTQPYTATTTTTKSIAEKVLDSTINIPPTLTRNRGERLMVLVNRDLWFDGVYNVMKR
ncbi:type IV secretion system protein VirB10 [Delftia sp. GW456-R20]|uniref:type IV secretion system protein VirB10 n=1 Tax=Delftia sp. GW456-R20 TaxID=1827145 RepID=UPI0018D420E0|nr:type IV secretion system protein VirB10 [Delftia sp. GW456-R20]